MFNVAPQSPYLAATVGAFRRRRRAISNKGVQLLVERRVETTDGEQFEKIEITYRRRRGGKFPIIRLFVWSDRWAWMDAREAATTGWRWKFSVEGRLVGGDTGEAVVAACEGTIAKIGSDPASIAQNLGDVWRPLLTTRPRLLRP